MTHARLMSPGQRASARRYAGAVFAAAFFMFAGSAAHAIERIGSATQIVQTVTGEIQANFRYLILQDPVYQDEVIATRPGSASRIIFRDNTELQVGPLARVTLDSFVFDPDPSIARFVISAFDGIFRFTTGKLAKTAYQIETPTAVIGVRGTTFVSVFSPQGEQVILLEEGIAVTVQDRKGGLLRTLSQPGLSVSIRDDGSVSEPQTPPEWALEKRRELDALLRTLDELIRGDDLDDDQPVAPLPPVQKAALPKPVPAAKPPHIHKHKHHKPHPKPRHRALERAHDVAAEPAREHGLARASVRADIRAHGEVAHGNKRSDIRIERRSRRTITHIERDDDRDNVPAHSARLEARNHVNSHATKDDSRGRSHATRSSHGRDRSRNYADNASRPEHQGRNRDAADNDRDRGSRDRGGHDRSDHDRGDRDRGGHDRGGRHR